MEAKAFLLRPDIPPEGRVRQPRPGEATDGALSEPLRTYAEEAGLVMRRPPITSYSVPALEASEFAKEHGAFDQFHHEAYRAYWEFGQDIGRLEVLQEVARGVGLNPEALADALHEGRYRPQVQEQFQEAIQTGVRGIPSFLIGEFFFSGARPYELFRMVMNKVLQGSPS